MGNRTLTESEIVAWEASLRQADVSQEIRSTFIRHWVEEELLYQAAEDLGLMDDAWVAQRLDEISRTLLISRMLDLEYGKIKPPSAVAIQKYFQQNSSEFTWPHLHLVVDYWRSEDRRSLEQLRSNLVRGRQAGIWSGKAGTLENGRITLDGVDSSIPEVWNVTSRLSTGEVSRVMQINKDNWIFKLIDRREIGEPQGLDDVQEEIMQRLMEETRHNVKDEFIRRLVDEFRRSGQLQWPSQPRPAVSKPCSSARLSFSAVFRQVQFSAAAADSHPFSASRCRDSHR